MKESLDQQLCNKYPLIFADRNKSATESCMYWGFSCSDGWYNIIDMLCSNIQGHINHVNKRRIQLLENNPHNLEIPKEIPQVVAQQVKEKFGTLNFYYQGGDDTISGMVRMAESISAVTCEQCGAPGDTRGPGWIKTLCDLHRKERA
jgi:hypothetical protein